MTRAVRVALIGLLALTVPLGSLPAAHADVPKAVAKTTTAARKKSSDALLKLGKWCIAQKAFESAREELQLAITLAPDPKKARKELAKIAGKDDAPRDGFEDSFDAKRDEAHTSCTELLFGAADGALAANSTEGFDDVVSLLIEVFPDAGTKTRYELSWFEPYVRWVRKEDRDRFDAGGEFVDGAWLDAEAVDKLDAEHNSWEKRWKVGNGTFRVETAKPLRVVNTFLSHATAFRKWFLAEFGDVWEMQAPKGELPILVTRDQAEYQTIYGKYMPGEGPNVMGLYLIRTAPLSPVIMTFEPVFSGDGPRKVKFHVLQKTLYHEVAHQIGMEYSAFEAKGGVDFPHHFWVVEGIANHCSWMVPGERGWQQTRPNKFETIPGFAATGSIAWIKANIGSIPPLAEFMKTSKPNFHGQKKYDQGTAAAYFLLTYGQGVYRTAFLELCQDVHRRGGSADGFTSRLDGVTMDEVQTQFVEFIRATSIDR